MSYGIYLAQEDGDLRIHLTTAMMNSGHAHEHEHLHIGLPVHVHITLWVIVK